jgi:Outer membrane lipoprotein carrier protein LolA-like
MQKRRAEHPTAAMHACHARLFCMAFVLMALPARAAADDTLDAVMQSLAARHHGHARFTERQYVSLLKNPLDLTGDLYFQAPDHLEKITRTPVAESLVIDKGTLTMARGAKHHSVSLQGYPQIGAFIDSIRATLAGDRASLERTYTLTFKSDARQWDLSLAPRDKKLAGIVREIHITGASDTIGRIETIRADGDRSVMLITQVPDT